jgi:hypothetical protein
MSQLWSDMCAKRPPKSIATRAVMVGDCKAVGGNELMSVQFLIHPFEALISDRSLGFAIFRKLSKAVLKQWIGVLGRATDWSEQFQFHPAIPPLDFRLFAHAAPEEVGFRLKPLRIPADCNRLGQV